MATTQEKLTGARDALHKLQIGQQAVEVRDSNGESVRFTASNVSRLRIYIKDLEAQLASELVGTTRPVGPMVLRFGGY